MCDIKKKVGGGRWNVIHRTHIDVMYSFYISDGIYFRYINLMNVNGIWWIFTHLINNVQ